MRDLPPEIVIARLVALTETVRAMVQSMGTLDQHLTQDRALEGVAMQQFPGQPETAWPRLRYLAAQAVDDIFRF